ncbi:hypothetical protein KIK15_05555 [Williamsia sp. CHRR-6]|nr:hypothetical protein [Williamsia sp. CHRR-6]
MEDEAMPTWRSITAEEPRWAASVAVVAVIGLQLALPAHLHLVSRYLLPTIEAGLLVTLIVANPLRQDRHSRSFRALGLTLIAVASLANAYSAAQLIADIVNARHQLTPVQLLATGGAVYVTNIIIFGLWYWELDRGGPAARAAGEHAHPDFLFPQMTTPDLAPVDWEPTFTDYLYVSFTNATAFSPTDTMPLSRWAKLTMMGQSAVALVTLAMVLARAINVLN